MTVTSTKCTVCNHVERIRAELLVAGGASLAAVSRKFNLSPDALERHWRNHVSDDRRAILVLGPVQRAALAARVAEESESVLDHHRVVRAGLLQRYDAACEAGDNHAVALLAARLTAVNNSIGQLTGQLASSPLIQQSTLNLFIHEPAFASFQADLIRVLSRFPDAYEAVLSEFERLERDTSSELRAALPALEHHAESLA